MMSYTSISFLKCLKMSLKDISKESKRAQSRWPRSPPYRSLGPALRKKTRGKGGVKGWQWLVWLVGLVV